MERKDGKKNEETMRIRMSKDLHNRILAAKVPTGWGEEADSSFARYLIILGLEEAEALIKEKKTSKTQDEKRDRRADTSKKIVLP